MVTNVTFLYSEWDETVGTDGANVEAHYHLWTNICGFHDADQRLLPKSKSRTKRTPMTHKFHDPIFDLRESVLSVLSAVGFLRLLCKAWRPVASLLSSQIAFWRLFKFLFAAGTAEIKHLPMEFRFMFCLALFHHHAADGIFRFSLNHI